MLASLVALAGEADVLERQAKSVGYWAPAAIGTVTVACPSGASRFDLGLVTLPHLPQQLARPRLVKLVFHGFRDSILWAFFCQAAIFCFVDKVSVVLYTQLAKAKQYKITAQEKIIARE